MVVERIKTYCLPARATDDIVSKQATVDKLRLSRPERFRMGHSACFSGRTLTYNDSAATPMQNVQLFPVPSNFDFGRNLRFYGIVTMVLREFQ